MNRAGRARDPSGRGDWCPLEHWGSRAPCGSTHYIWGPPVTPATALPSASDLSVQRDCLDGLRAKLQGEVEGRTWADVGRPASLESGAFRHHASLPLSVGWGSRSGWALLGLAESSAQT